ncbi:hypothetical protein SAY87_021776 [Trapa incisa]|uniref:Uncharacterized protein n=1 Tax=Trapa incisa TaxID=236973 RepID=A0AAN7JXK4_9MYRT|nr:hypothetical protein SAY87_021776 [Trapa incisa]
MAFDIALCRVSSIRLSAMLSWIHEEGITKMVHSALNTEAKVRSAYSWPALEPHSLDHITRVDVFKVVEDNMNYHKLLEEKEEVAATIAPAAPVGQEDSKAEDDAGEQKDPFCSQR